MRADLETGGWVALSNVGAWIDQNFGSWRRLAAGWHDMDRVLADALLGGLVGARGYRDQRELLPVRIEPGATIAVRSLLEQVTVTVTATGWGPGAPISRMESRDYGEVEISAQSLRAWCASILGEPAAAAPNPAPVAPLAARPRPMRGPVLEAITQIFGADWPVAPFDKRLIDRVAGELAAEDLTPSKSTIRRALRDGP